MSVEQVKSWMTFLGWTNGGAPGAVKMTYGNSVIARYGDDTWKADVDHSQKQIDREREKLRDEELQRLGLTK